MEGEVGLRGKVSGGGGRRGNRIKNDKKKNVTQCLACLVGIVRVPKGWVQRLLAFNCVKAGARKSFQGVDVLAGGAGDHQGNRCWDRGPWFNGRKR